ncbi:hypothetical protein IMZ48_46030 [Candidatus Bathyarchaeota archaeon]|nr:hypothetical protein [Candidatus Bathyarchaeota archaeon]
MCPSHLDLVNRNLAPEDKPHGCRQNSVALWNARLSHCESRVMLPVILRTGAISQSPELDPSAPLPLRLPLQLLTLRPGLSHMWMIGGGDSGPPSVIVEDAVEAGS